ncbi:PQQ-binding-like beta-propeller repeat protein [Haloarcula pelagica]|uniref:outer membrane protein assembly factor BamB family protein n=1 Tax=Haloarcula pelagica TaxID=3033389 RepID=UPI0024C4469B|nr:PQQ-binding-like beta-propeller repeat protein [Halomicroarcula sp. YJ-61-S]
MTDRSRREVLGALGAAGLAGVAGCASDGSSDDDSSESVGSCPPYDPTVSPTAGWTTRLGGRRGTSTVPANAMPGPEPSRDWTFEFDTAIGYHTPIVVDGTVYVSDLDTTMWALDAASGEVRWETSVPEYPGAPAVADGTLVYFADQDVRALDAASGETLWTALETGGRLLDARPVIADGTAYVQVGIATYALDLTTGETEWRDATGLPSEVTPAVADGTVFSGGDDTYVRALSTADGSQRWRYKAGDRIEANVCVAGGRVFAGSRDGIVHALSAADGSRQWSYRLPKDEGDRPEPETVTSDGSRVYVLAGGKLHTLAAADGTVCWSRPDLSGSYNTGLAVGDGRLYVPTDRRETQFATLDPATGERLGTWGVADAYFESGPAVADGAAYVSGGTGVARFS